MKPRSIAFLAAVALFSHLVHAQEAPATVEAPDALPDCTFEGNSDFYGIGVRLGFYFTWFSGLIAFVLNPEDSDAQADAQTIFLLANLIALIILQVQRAPDTNVVVPILLFYMFFGGSISAVTSATTSLSGWNKAHRTKRIALITRQIFVQLTFLTTLAYSFYFWTTGFKQFKHFDPRVCNGGTFVFPVSHRVEFEAPAAGSVLALVILIVLILLIWFVAYTRLRLSFPTHAPINGSWINLGGGGAPLPPWEGRQRIWTIIGGSLIALVIMWSIAGIELTLKWNNVTNVNGLGTTGQLIPFIIGIASFPSAIWGAFENWQDVKEEENHELNKLESQELLRSPKSREQSFLKERIQSE